MKQLIVVLLCTLFTGCATVQEGIKKATVGPEPEIKGFSVHNVKKTPDEIQFDIAVHTNTKTERIELITKVYSEAGNWESAPLVTKNVPQGALAKAKRKMGIVVKFAISHDVERVRFIATALREKGSGQSFWQKKHTMRLTLTKSEILKFQ